MLCHASYSGVPNIPCAVFRLVADSEAISERKQPQLLVWPFLSLSASVVIVWPHSHSQRHVARPLRFGARQTTVSLPNTLPVKSSNLMCRGLVGVSRHG